MSREDVSSTSHPSKLFYLLESGRGRQLSREIAAARNVDLEVIPASLPHSPSPSLLTSPSSSLVTRRQLRGAERTKERQQSVGRSLPAACHLDVDTGSVSVVGGGRQYFLAKRSNVIRREEKSEGGKRKTVGRIYGNDSSLPPSQAIAARRPRILRSSPRTAKVSLDILQWGNVSRRARTTGRFRK